MRVWVGEGGGFWKVGQDVHFVQLELLEVQAVLAFERCSRANRGMDTRVAERQNVSGLLAHLTQNTVRGGGKRVKGRPSETAR